MFVGAAPNDVGERPRGGEEEKGANNVLQQGAPAPSVGGGGGDCDRGTGNQRATNLGKIPRSQPRIVRNCDCQGDQAGPEGTQEVQSAPGGSSTRAGGEQGDFTLGAACSDSGLSDDVAAGRHNHGDRRGRGNTPNGGGCQAAIRGQRGHHGESG